MALNYLSTKVLSMFVTFDEINMSCDELVYMYYKKN